MYERLASELGNIKESSALWHSSCYASYTSHENLKYIKKAPPEAYLTGSDSSSFNRIKDVRDNA